MRPATLVSIGFACVFAHACKERPAPAARHASTAQPQGAPAVPASALLTTDGTPPRRPLSYRTKDPWQRTIAVELRVRVTVEQPGTPAEDRPMPAVRATVSAVFEPPDNLRFTIRDVILKDDAGHDRETVNRLRKGLRTLSGSTLGGTLSPHGATLLPRFESPSPVALEATHVAESLRHALAHLVPPLPAEPVGVGASWRTANTMVSVNMKVTEQITYELTVLDQDTGTLQAVSTLTAPKQPARYPGSPKNAPNAELTEFSGSGNGEYMFDLASALPLRARLSSADTAVYWQSDPKDRLLRTKSYVTITIERM